MKLINFIWPLKTNKTKDTQEIFVKGDELSAHVSCFIKVSDILCPNESNGRHIHSVSSSSRRSSGESSSSGRDPSLLTKAVGSPDWADKNSWSNLGISTIDFGTDTSDEDPVSTPLLADCIPDGSFDFDLSPTEDLIFEKKPGDFEESIEDRTGFKEVGDSSSESLSSMDDLSFSFLDMM